MRRWLIAEFAFVIFFVFNINCSNRLPAVSKQNKAEYYNTATSQLSAEYVLYNQTSSSTRLFFKVNAEQLLYSRNANETSYTARLMLNYIMHPLSSPKTISDSGQVILTDEGSPGVSKLLTSFIDMKVRQPGEYFIEVTLRDLNRMTLFNSLLYLNQNVKDVSQNFLVTLPGSSIPLFNEHIDSGQTVQIRYHIPGIRRLFVRYHKPIEYPAPPPYSVYEEKEKQYPADSSWWTSPDSVFRLQFNQSGWYTLHSDSSSLMGLQICRFRTSYPKLAHPIQLLTPIRYLTNKQEYARIASATNIKAEVDKFWLNSAGSEERAREVIRQFYTRVEKANRLFTSNREGWQTDRGMIYLLFGSPTSVYQLPGYETWYYGNDLATTSALSFTFNYTAIGANTDFILERNMSYKLNWTVAVDTWRQGQVFTAR